MRSACSRLPGAGARSLASLTHNSGSAAGGTPSRFMPVSTFKWTGKTSLLLPRRFFQALDVPALPDGRRQIVRDDAVFFAPPDSGHEKNAGPDAGAAQRASFGGVGYAEPWRALGFESERALGCAVAISIGFHDRADGDVCARRALALRENFRAGWRAKLPPMCAHRGPASGESGRVKRSRRGAFTSAIIATARNSVRISSRNQFRRHTLVMPSLRRDAARASLPR